MTDLSDYTTTMSRVAHAADRIYIKGDRSNAIRINEELVSIEFNEGEDCIEFATDAPITLNWLGQGKATDINGEERELECFVMRCLDKEDVK